MANGIPHGGLRFNLGLCRKPCAFVGRRETAVARARLLPSCSDILQVRILRELEAGVCPVRITQGPNRANPPVDRSIDLRQFSTGGFHVSALSGEERLSELGRRSGSTLNSRMWARLAYAAPIPPD